MQRKFRSKWIKCGKRCGGCPHGPYWYEYGYKGGRQWSKYLGKELPGEPSPDERSQPGQWNEIFSERTASEKLAREILGVTIDANWSEIRRAYRDRMAAEHPDRGGEEKLAKCLNCAFEYLRAKL